LHSYNLNQININISNMAAIPVVPPQLGGMHHGHPWTGGKPANVDQNATLNVEPRTPACIRPSDPTNALKVWTQLTKPDVGTPPFKRNDSLANFERRIMTHLESTGCDGVAYMTPPYDPTNFSNIITHHSQVTLEMVVKYWSARLVANTVDTYKLSNLRFFKDWLLASLDPDLANVILDKLTPDGLGPEVWMLLVLEIRSKSFLYYKSLKTTLKSIKLSHFPGDNVRDFTAMWVKTANELQVANAFDYHFLVNLVTELTKTTVQLFVMAMVALHTRVLHYTNQLCLLGTAAQAAMLAGANAITYCSICMEADNLYRSLLENGKWTPAVAVIPSTPTTPKFNSMSIKQFNALVQRMSNSGQARDPSTVTCYNCQKVGHYANKCPAPKVNSPQGGPTNNPPPPSDGNVGWKRTPPGAGQPEIKEVKQPDGSNKNFFWCAKCARFTPSHGTANHALYRRYRYDVKVK
jgi:hypothetical protein